jgi:hypothetical protein
VAKYSLKVAGEPSRRRPLGHAGRRRLRLDVIAALYSCTQIQAAFSGACGASSE